jgi:hypothetical protein
MERDKSTTIFGHLLPALKIELGEIVHAGFYFELQAGSSERLK